jgi:hypothetical protein
MKRKMDVAETVLNEISPTDKKVNKRRSLIFNRQSIVYDQGLSFIQIFLILFLIINFYLKFLKIILLLLFYRSGEYRYN